MRTLAVPAGRGPSARPQPATLQCAGAPHPHAGLRSWAQGSPEHVSLDSALVLPLFFSSDNPSRLGHPPLGGGAGLCVASDLTVVFTSVEADAVQA